MSQDCREQKSSNNKRYERAEKTIDGYKDDLVSCLLMMENKKENVKKRVWLAEDFKQPSEADMMCNIDGDTFFLFTKNTWIGDSGALCHIMNNDTGLFEIINISKLIQRSSGIMPAMKKGKLYVNVQQVNGTEWFHMLWPMKFCPKAGANLFSVTCKFLQGKTTLIVHQNNIMIKSMDGNVILDC